MHDNDFFPASSKKIHIDDKLLPYIRCVLFFALWLAGGGDDGVTIFTEEEEEEEEGAKEGKGK